MELVDALVLKSLSGVGGGAITKLFDFTSRHGLSSLEDLARCGVQNLPFKKPPASLAEFLAARDFDVSRLSVEDNLRDLESQGITAITRISEKYPQRLLALEDPPPFLFCKGNLQLLQEARAIAVVGTRKISPKGELIATKTVEAFGSRNFVIVSGLALGIDTIAHRAALSCGAPTVAVLVDLGKISPSKNKQLADEIIENGGLLVAENQPGTTTIAALFAKRDRIQSGLSTAVFAIETSKDGGTMHAVRAAGKLSRPVFVPDPVAAKYGDLTAKVIEGTQYLIKNEVARPYSSSSYEEISEELASIAQRIEMPPSYEAQEELLL